mgnify:FL=1
MGRHMNAPIASGASAAVSAQQLVEGCRRRASGQPDVRRAADLDGLSAGAISIITIIISIIIVVGFGFVVLVIVHGIVDRCRLVSAASISIVSIVSMIAASSAVDEFHDPFLGDTRDSSFVCSTALVGVVAVHADDQMRDCRRDGVGVRGAVLGQQVPEGTADHAERARDAEAHAALGASTA